MDTTVAGNRRSTFVPLVDDLGYIGLALSLAEAHATIDQLAAPLPDAPLVRISEGYRRGDDVEFYESEGWLQDAASRLVNTAGKTWTPMRGAIMQDTTTKGYIR